MLAPQIFGAKRVLAIRRHATGAVHTVGEGDGHKLAPPCAVGLFSTPGTWIEEALQSFRRRRPGDDLGG